MSTDGTHHLRKILSVATILVAVLLLAQSTLVQAADIPTVVTDKQDYAPNETVIITGTNFTPGAFYDVPVIRPDGSVVKGDGSFLPGFDTVQADASGGFVYNYQLNGVMGEYEVRVYDEAWNPAGATNIDNPAYAELPIASVKFTDGELDWNQCQNDSDNNGQQDDCEWTTGSLGSNNSIYTEGEVVPHRQFRLIDAAGSHYVVIDHSFYDSSKEAYTYDFFASPDATQGSLLEPCLQLPTGGDWNPFFGGGVTYCSNLVSGKSEVAIPTESTYTIGSPPVSYTYPFVAGAEADGALDGVSRNLWISCGAFVSGTFTTGQCSDVRIQILGHGAHNGVLLPGSEQEGPPTSDDFVQMRVSFDTLQPNTVVAIWVGAHLAKQFYWGSVSNPDFQAMGAATAAGASFHVRLIDWDENQAIGKRDNQMQGSVVVPPAIKTGYKWDDRNANGIWDTGEPALPGWTIFVDYDNDGQLDSGLEPFDVTDANGFYEIRLIRNGTWRVREVPQDGWTCSFPTTTDTYGCYHEETFMGGNIYPNNNFGNYQAAFLTITKTASTSLTRTNTWTITKGPDGVYSRFIGESATHGYTVSVDRTTTDSSWAVSGTITIANTTPRAATITGVEDVVSPFIPAFVNCGVTFPYTLLAGGTLNCTYSASLPDAAARTNTVTVTTSGNVFGGTATADVSFADPTVTVVGPTSVDVTDTNGESWTASDDASWSYDETFTCSNNPAAYTNGTYDILHTNTARVKDGDTVLDDDTASVTVHCYAPVVSKTAAAGYTRTYDWTITKGPDGTYNRFAGESATHGYTVTVDRTETDSAFAVSGVITVQNPNPSAPMTVSLADSVGGTAATITADADCDYEDGELTIPAGGTATCGYSASLASKTNGTNTATVTFNSIPFTATAAYAFGDPTTIVGSETISVTDTNGGLWTASDDDSRSYDETFTCSDDPADYAGDGTYDIVHPNTASIVGMTGKSDGATVTVHCYGPIITKTAAGTYDERHEWDVEKTVDPTSQSGFAGDTLPFTWTITVTESVFEENFDAAGTITVQNPAPMVMTVALSDVLSDSTAAVIGSCTNGATYADGSLTIPANTTTECSYTANDLAYTDDAAAPTGNTATATLNGIAFAASDPVEWTANPINPTATLTDEQGPLNEPLTGHSQAGTYTFGPFTYDDSYTCSTDTTEYTSNYSYTETIFNTAVVTSETEEQDSDTISTEIDCYIPEISKTAAGTYDERHEWDVTKTVDPTSQSAFAGDTVDYEWTVVVTEEVFEENFAVAGTITVKNHNPEDAMTVALSDVLSDSTDATITACTGDADLSDGLTIAAGGTSVCDYSAALTYDDVDNAPTNNTATVVLNDISYSASDAIEWAANVIRGSATVTDNQIGLDETITEGDTWTYTEQYTCSSDKALYEGDNTYTFDEDNIAIVTSDGAEEDRDDASVEIDCYVPVISKTANGRYDEVHDWEVFKSVNTASQSAFAGEHRSFTWTVRVDETTHGENYSVTGVITVVNPNPEDELTVELSDELNDGSEATIGPCTGGTLVGNVLTVPAGGTATCDYSVVPSGDLDAFAAALPNAVTMKVTYPYGGGPAYFPVTTISGDADLNGTYEGWCVDTDRTINENTNYTANVFSSYEELPAGLVEHPENFDLVNWIINQDFVGKPAGGSLGNYTYGDVQRAIWTLIEDVNSTNGLGDWNPTRVSQILAAAQADGEDFEPTCGDFVAVVLQPTSLTNQVITIAQVTFASLGIDCAESNAVTAVLNGIEFPASAEILWTVNKINETASLDDDQKLDWPTPVSADTTFTYTDPQGYTCSSNPAAYTNGFYQYNESNTAVLTFSTGSDTATASTAVRCYAPVVTKTAAGTYDERHEWDVEKTVDPISQNGFAGDTLPFTWTVTVTESVFEENFVASGTISVRNPRPDDGNMVVKLTDVLSDDFTATITGCTGGTWNEANKTVAVPPNTTAVCSYIASVVYSDDANAPTLNTVTAELMAGATHLTTTASDRIEWAANVIRGEAELTDLQGPLSETITGSGTWTIEDSHTCSTVAGDYTNGSYTHPESNTATVTSGDKSDSSTANTSVNCYAPVVTKTADEYFNRDWDWTITKDFDATYDLFAGGSVTHNYVVTVDPVYTDNFWGVKGTITITNNHPTEDMTLTSVSDLAGGIDGVVTCDSLVVPAAGSLTCTYDTGAQDSPDDNPFGDTNTATAAFAGADWTGSEDIVFSATPTTEDEPVITVDDNNLTGEVWSADRVYAEWRYTQDFACPTNPAAYTNGRYSYSHTNTAEIVETDQTDTATVAVNCYAPVVTKTADEYFNRDWDWTITKDYDGSYNLFAGDTVTHGYKVTVTPTYTDNFWGVSGTITITNNHPTQAMTLTSVSDLAGGIDGVVTCDSLVVPAAGSLTCTYDTGPQTSPNANPFGDTNTATAVFAGADWTGSEDIVFSATPTTEDEPVITVDDNNLTGESWSADRDYAEWTYTRDFACPTNPAAYTNGRYSYSHTNTARITQTGQTDTATVDVTCYWPQIEITKTGDELSKIGDDVTYTITLYNNTPTNAGLRALSCTISDPLIGFSKTVTLASGASDTSTVPFTIPAGADDPFENTATVTCTPVDATFSVSDSATWSTNLFQPAVEIIKTGPVYAYYGDTITYTFTINNLSSSDSPDLVLDSINDVGDGWPGLGDLMDDAPAACDVLASGESCTFTVAYTIPTILEDAPIPPSPLNNTVTVLYHPVGFPNDITDTDDHSVTVLRKSELTNTSFCPLQDYQFRLLFIQDPILKPNGTYDLNAYRLNASNPGQFYYNVFYMGTPGGEVTLDIDIPYPFVTQGAVPIQVHDGVMVAGGTGCYTPSPSLPGYVITSEEGNLSTSGNPVILLGDYDPQKLGSTTTVTVTGEVPASGLLYVTIHLDYGLKKTTAWKAVDSDGDGATDDARSDTLGLTLTSPQAYTFSYRVDGAPADTTSPASTNEFKRNPGTAGQVLQASTGNPLAGVLVELVGPTGRVVGRATTDADGVYIISYKHTGKTATYTVRLPNYGLSQKVALKANGFAIVTFDVP